LHISVTGAVDEWCILKIFATMDRTNIPWSSPHPEEIKEGWPCTIPPPEIFRRGFDISLVEPEDRIQA